MNKPDKLGPGGGGPPANNNGNGAPAAAPRLSAAAQQADLAGNERLIQQVRQIIAATPEVRPEKVGPLKEAVDQGTYGVDTRKLATILITELILKP